jgi:fused signal recognition particle receptor
MLKWFKKKLGFGADETAPESAEVVDVPAEDVVDAPAVEEEAELPPPLPVPEPTEKTTADLTALATSQGAYKLEPPAELMAAPQPEAEPETEGVEAPAPEVKAEALRPHLTEPVAAALPDEAAELETFAGEAEALATDAELPATEPATGVPLETEPEEKRGWFARLRDRLSKTTDSLVNKVRSAIRLRGKVDEELLEEIEEILIQSDVGVTTTMKIVERMRKEGRKQEALGGDALLTLFKESIEEILRDHNRVLELDRAKPMILLMVGVNGTGKTTTIGKIAQTLVGQGKLVMMVAADTFRAAASEQLTIWAERTGSCIVRQQEGADPAAVVYEALEGAKQGPTPDVILIDTAGRLHTKVNLMEELKKIVRVIRKFYPDGPHETILVLDATTGQNAVNQVQIFHEAAELTGLIMTKLDGTAKGGILIACKDLYNLPVFKIGIGEGADDLRDFDPHDFVDALFSNNAE